MSSIGYQGSVTIVKKLRGKYIGTEHYHNNGTRWLFDYLCNYLWNGNVNESGKPDMRGVPYYLDIIGVQDGKSLGSILTAPVYTYQAEVNRQVATEKMYPYIQKKFYLGFNNFKSSLDFSNPDSLYMVLLNSSGDTKYLATIPLVGANNKPLTTYDIKEGESHEIYWKMEFINPAEQQISPDSKIQEGENS